MTAYAAPLDDMRFVINELADLAAINALPGFEEASPDLVDAILEEAGRFAAGAWAPLNQSGDVEGCRLENGVVRTPKGFPEAYRQFVEAGWNAIGFDPDYGGQGLPWLIETAVSEMMDSANMGFSLCPMLTKGAVELLQAHGSPEQKDAFLPKLISGEWTGTMCLTESQAGSDLGALRTKAVRDGDVYRISGQKIFITHGEHDMADNIVHMVLARTPDAPDGVKGISLFIVPKFLVNADGSLGARNDVRAVALEHKLGIHSSPTCTMSFGDEGGAIGYLVEAENQGIRCMFTMMNNARLAVGLEGVAIAERAYQTALAYARERVQSRDIADPAGDPVAIIAHPDVRRMLLSMKAQAQAARAIVYLTAAALDHGKRNPDEATRARMEARAGLLTPIAKAWSTDTGIEVANTGIQVHGGMGFVEETGAAQHLRDARIAAIYEGTNGIQANDLMGRKVVRDKGAAMAELIAEMRAADADLTEQPALRARLGDAVAALEKATAWVVETYRADPRRAAAGAAPYLRLAGHAVGCWLMARGAARAQAMLAAGQGDPNHLRSRIACARFFADHVAVQAPGLAETVMTGADATLDLDEDAF